MTVPGLPNLSRICLEDSSLGGRHTVLIWVGLVILVPSAPLCRFSLCLSKLYLFEKVLEQTWQVKPLLFSTTGLVTWETLALGLALPLGLGLAREPGLPLGLQLPLGLPMALGPPLELARELGPPLGLPLARELGLSLTFWFQVGLPLVGLFLPLCEKQFFTLRASHLPLITYSSMFSSLHFLLETLSHKPGTGRKSSHEMISNV